MKQSKKGIEFIRDVIFDVVTEKKNLKKLKTAMQEAKTKGEMTQDEIDKAINFLEKIRRAKNEKKP